jgi:hypothetical protein
MRSLVDEIDLHIVPLLVVFTPLFYLGGWCLLPAILVPQGRIFVRVLSGYPTCVNRPWRYLAVNELLVLGSVAMGFGAQSLFGPAIGFP